MQAGLSCLEGFFRDFSPLMAQRGPCGRRAILGLSKDERSTPLCHRPLARTGPYALPFLQQTRERRPLHNPHPRTHPPSFPHTPQRHSRTGGNPEVGRGAGAWVGGPRHESNQRCKATPKLPGGLHQQTINPFPLFQVQNPQKTLQTIHRRKTFKPAPPPRLQLRLRRVRRDQRDRCARRAPCGQS